MRQTAAMKSRRSLSPWLCVLCSPFFSGFAAAEPEPSIDEAPAAVEFSVPDESTAAGASIEPFAWLDRIALASQQLNYAGTFSYQMGGRSETSRITHRYANGEESERLEVLDGSPREVIRQGGEIRCVLPAQRTVIISRAGVRASFPARLSQSHAELGSNYRVRAGELGRIAGHEARKLVLEPRDGLRFGHVLWAEKRSGLLLKSQVLDSKGGVIEQFAFSDVRIGGDVDDESLAPKVQTGMDWRVIDAGSDDVTQDEGRWRLKEPLPGFSLMSKMHHRNSSTLQMVFSDGLAAISIFIEPAEAGVEARGGFPSGGAVNAFERIVSGHRITALGEVPADAAQRAAEAVEALAP